MATATLNGATAASVVVLLPERGIACAQVSLTDESADLAEGSSCKLVLGDLTFLGTVIRGGAWRGRSDWQIVAGAGGWRKPIKRRGYRNESGVKLSSVINHLVQDNGETVVMPATDPRVGPAYIRVEDAPGSDVLTAVAPDWNVREDGKTYLVARPVSTFDGEYSLQSFNAARRSLAIVSDLVAPFVPGLTLEGVAIATVRHELLGNALRTMMWGRM